MEKKLIRNSAIAAASLLILGACATATPYQPSQGGQSGFGYEDTRIETGKYRVGFRGNTNTNRATVENYVLLRAAELALADGFGHFIILGEGEGSTSNFNSTGFNNGFAGGGFGGHGFGRRGFGGFGGTTSSRTRERRNFDINVIVQAFPGEKSAENFAAFNAQEVVNNLRPGA